MRVVPFCIVASIAAFSPQAHAHHSQATFDVARTVTVEGKVVAFEWANPHVYIFVDQKAEDGKATEWKIEGVGIGPLRRLGWSRDTLGVGDEITVVGNPDRTDDRSLKLQSLRKDGAILFDPQGLISVFSVASDAPKAVADSLSGTWATLLAMNVVIPLTVAPQGAIPLTAAGEAALKAYDERTMAPALQCIPQPAPFLMYVPNIMRITTGERTITIEGDYEATERTIHMDLSDHEGAPPSLHGHSIGRWDSGTLIIDTAAFANHRTGNAAGVPSGAQKHLVERLTRSDDATSLTYQFELTDPEFLAAPVTGEVRWAYRPAIAFERNECSLAAARRFTERSAQAPDTRDE